MNTEEFEKCFEAVKQEYLNRFNLAYKKEKNDLIKAFYESPRGDYTEAVKKFSMKTILMLIGHFYMSILLLKEESENK